METAGIPTVCMTSAWSITASVNPPRGVFLDFPLGHTAGRPFQPEEQLAIMRAATSRFHAAEAPGEIVPLPDVWAEPWKEAARALVDHRTPRHETPQYQSEEDRRAAIERFGAEVACTVCAPARVPAG